MILEDIPKFKFSYLLPLVVLGAGNPVGDILAGRLGALAAQLELLGHQQLVEVVVKEDEVLAVLLRQGLAGEAKELLVLVEEALRRYTGGLHGGIGLHKLGEQREFLLVVFPPVQGVQVLVDGLVLQQLLNFSVHFLVHSVLMLIWNLGTSTSPPSRQ